MTIKRNYVVGIIDHNRIDDVNNVIYSYAEATMESSSHLYFAKQPLTGERYVRDATFFKLMAENEDDLNKKVNNLISDLDKVDVDYVLKDEESGELLSVVEFGGTLFVKFDNLNIIKEGTFKQLDDLKQLKTDFGYITHNELISHLILFTHPITRGIRIITTIIIVSHAKFFSIHSLR